MTVPIVYIDCSAMMRGLYDELGRVNGLIVHEGDPSPAELAALLSDTPIVLNGHTTMDEALLSRAPNLRSIVFLGTGASSISI